MRYAIKVPFDGIWIYLTEGDSIFQLRVRTFETREKAEKFAEPWVVYEIVEYGED